MARAGRLDGVDLVAVEGEGPRAGILDAFLDPEDSLVLWVEEAAADQVRNRSTGFETGIQREPGIRPLDAGVQLRLDEFGDAGVTGAHESRGEGPVILDQLAVHLKDVHCFPVPNSCESSLTAHAMVSSLKPI